MRRLWTHRDIPAPAAVVWGLLVDTDAWPAWGPTVRAATVEGGALGPGATGTVTTAIGLDLPFEIVQFEEGRHWSWTVAGVPATEHSVERTDDDRCRAGFGVPWVVAPYLAVCRLALRRIETLAVDVGRSPD